METTKNFSFRNIVLLTTIPAALIALGVGIYHGTFHMTSNTTHCHENVCHNH
jgi:hypothetical protein